MMSDEYTIAKYLRLSLEDGDLDEAKDESNSISNQRKLLDYYIEQHPDLSGAKILEFVDDGYSGTSFDRPGVQKLLQMVGDSFDNSKPCLEANGFRQMRDAAKQGRVDNVLVYTLDGLSKRSKNYARFQRQIEKRHVLMYDRNGNLLIGT